jgi:hypothetical protein
MFFINFLFSFYLSLFILYLFSQYTFPFSAPYFSDSIGTIIGTNISFTMVKSNWGTIEKMEPKKQVEALCLKEISGA